MWESICDVQFSQCRFMWESVGIVLNCLLIIFLFFHVNTTADNRRTNMTVG